MNEKNTYSKQGLKTFQERIREQLSQHRENLKLSQVHVAGLVGKSPSTYQRWESTGTCLTNIHDFQKLFQVLKFSTSDVIELFGLPPLQQEELKTLFPDKNTRKAIEEDGICLYMRKNCANMETSTIEKLLDIVSDERLKRRRYKR